MQFKDEEIDSESIKLLFAGDFIPPESDSCLYSDDLIEFLSDKDFSVVNLECPLTESKNNISKAGVNIKRASKYISHIIEGQFDALCLSNNHIRDFDDAGVLDTIDTCKNHKIQYVGAGVNIYEAGKPLRINIKGKRISILNYCEIENSIATVEKAGANPFDLISAYSDIKREKQDNDFVFIIYHGGLEFHEVPLPKLKRTFEFLVGLGVNAIFCNHSHYVSGYTYHRNMPIFYGLGNFYMKYHSHRLLSDSNLHSGLIITVILKGEQISFKINGVFKSEDQNMLDLMVDEKQINGLHDKIERINSIIASEVKLDEYWNGFKRKYLREYYSKLGYSNSIIGKIFKRYACDCFIKYRWIRRIINLIRNDSHREILIRAFSD